MTAVWYSESLLAERLGITASAMSQYSRALKKNERKKQDGCWFIHETAADALLKGLGSADMDIATCALQENGQEPPAPTIVELTVSRIFNNPNLIEAEYGDGKKVRVKVPKNVNFQPRMTIKARIPVTATGPYPLYILEGRCPRYRGRW